MSGRPLIVLGIDALDWEYLDRHRAVLPTLAAWPVLSPLQSIFPPDSIPAWTTIFTGRGPADHGILDSIDHLDAEPGRAATKATRALSQSTFWDVASARGQRVCVVNAFLAYPAWQVNGTMVSGPVFVDGTASITGIEPRDLPPLPQLGGIVDFPTRRTIGQFVDQTLVATEEQAAFGLQLLRQSDPDLFFMNILTLDRLKHFVWRYIDSDDPTYPGPNPHQDAVKQMYALIDRIVADFMTEGDVMVLSDHGHGRRCTRMVYIDEALRRAGLVAEPQSRSRRLSKPFLMERAKRLLLRAAYEVGREDELYRIARRLPNRKALKYSSSARDENRPLARLSQTFGRNQHSGVELSPDTPATRHAVAEVLRSLVDPKTGQRVADWVREREDVLSGERLDRYPAILFKLRDGYGVDFGLYGDLFGPDVNHRRISGGHRLLGVFGSSRPVDTPPTSLEQFYDFVLGQISADARSPGQ